MTLHVRPEARSDLLLAAQWYETRETGLGPALVAEVDADLLRIEQGPHRYALRYRHLWSVASLMPSITG